MSASEMVREGAVRLARWGISELEDRIGHPHEADERKAPMFLMRGHHQNRPLIRMGNPFVMMFVLVESVFWGMVATCFLLAIHRIASAMRTEARIRALGSMPEAFTEEQRQVLVHKIKARTLSSL